MKQRSVWDSDLPAAPSLFSGGTSRLLKRTPVLECDGGGEGAGWLSPAAAAGEAVGCSALKDHFLAS